MVDLLIAAYFGVGVFIIQFMHTLYTTQAFGQKRVYFFEKFWPGFSRVDPAEPDRVHPPVPPWKLPHIQIEESAASRMTRYLGLHATNLFYCYAMSVVYGVLGFVAIAFFPSSPDRITLQYLGQFVGTILLLVAFSAIFVGVGNENVLLETNLGLNTILVVLVGAGLLEFRSMLGILQFAAALTAGPLVFWIEFHYEEGRVTLGRRMAVSFIAVSLLYSEFFGLLLGLAYK